MDLFSNIPSKEIIQLQHTSLELHNAFLSADEANNLKKHLWDFYQWEQAPIIVYGKEHLTPRLTAWVADQKIQYGYSQVTHQPQPWTNPLREIKERIEKISHHSFNSVLLNAYRDGNDKMGWHSDNEKELGPDPIIASLNLGATRRFDLRNIHDPADETKINLSNGSLLIMGSGCQKHYKHQIPSQKRINDMRINLTFRKVV